MTDIPKHRRRRLAGAAAVATLAAGFLVGTTTTTAAAAPAAGTYQLTVARSGQCLDVVAGSKDNSALLQQWGCSGGAWQQFRLEPLGGGAYQLRNVNSDRCLDVPSGTDVVGTRIQQWSCKPAQTNQQWTLTPSRDGSYLVSSVANGLCLSIQGASTTSGAAVIQEGCTHNTNKQWTFTAAGDGGGSTGDATVAADGSGTYRTVQQAVDAIPANATSKQRITVAPGTYRGKVVVGKDKPFVELVGLGDDPADVVIVDGVSAGEGGSHRGSATMVVEGASFSADNLTVSNDHDESEPGDGDQALALYLNADRVLLDDLRLLGDQDTLLVNDATRAYVTDTYVEGTVDFIYGGGVAVFHRSTIHEKRTTGGPITAASTPADRKYGFLFYQSRITGATNNTTQLGRPWRQGAQVLYRESDLSATIRTAQPWTDMSGSTWQNARFLEYRNTGAGAGVNSNRPQLSDAQAAEYTPQKYLAGSDGWNPVG
ncbi:pectinesterase family protein [Isoptericola sp. NPDC019693]|uniref:pectinesterase family protein n=1 Tax=Isoptericola sp. NPDC019693 TaxID=3364009 RepID=UPI0037AD5DBF